MTNGSFGTCVMPQTCKSVATEVVLRIHIPRSIATDGPGTPRTGTRNTTYSLMSTNKVVMAPKPSASKTCHLAGTSGRKVRDRFGNKVTAEDIAYANPRVNLYIGGNSIRFECLIPDSCLSQVRIWNVVNVEVKDIGPYENGKNGERKYQIRLIDSRDEIQPLRWVEMPTRRDERKQEWTQKDTQNQEYWQMGTATEYPDGYLRQACVGQCEPADAEYKECLARTQSRRLAEDLSNFTRS